MEKTVLDKYKKAGKIHASVIKKSKKWAKPGVKLFDLAEKIEADIKKQGGKPAFPVGLAVNDIGAHATPDVNDETKLGKDIIKIDIGVHVEGYIADGAYTLDFTGKNKKLVKASREALNAVLDIIKPGLNVGEIGKTVQETIEGYGYKPITNLTGHMLGRYDVHGDMQIPNIKIKTGAELEEGMVLAIEPFATDGDGYVKESETVIYRLVDKKPVRNREARIIQKIAESKFDLLPFTKRWIDMSPFKMAVAIKKLVDMGCLYEYPMLKERAGGLISQAEHSVIVSDNPIVFTRPE